MVSVEDRTLRGGGGQLKKKLWDAARSIISEWTGQELTECSLYGIRIYEEGAILATHVDRLPLGTRAACYLFPCLCAATRYFSKVHFFVLFCFVRCSLQRYYQCRAGRR